MRPPFDIPADLDTPVSAWLKLAPLQPRFLLESVEGGERLARYSFIGFGNALEVRLQDGVLSIGDDARPVPETTEGLLDAFREALRRAPRPGPAEGIPFTGGLVGATGYEIVRRFERVPDPRDPEPGFHPEVAWVAPESLLVFDHVTRRVALLHDGSEADRRALRDRVVELLAGPVPPFRNGGTLSEPRASLSKDAYEDGVRKIRDFIYEGDAYQMVLASRFEGETDLDPFQVYRALRLLNPSPYMTFFQLDDLAVVGSSPEALVKLSGRKATLRPIAGTRPRGATVAEDVAHEVELLADPKEAAEHVMLVDLARNDLGRVAVAGSVGVEPYRVIERYSHVMHIVSGVQGVLAPDYDQFDLFAATFPAGTVVGAPKIRAMELLDSLEPVKRGIYAGTVGYFGHNGVMDQAIAIRTLVFQGGRYSFEVGAGIVADSVPANEHAEIMAKGAAMAQALRLAAEGL